MAVWQQVKGRGWMTFEEEYIRENRDGWEESVETWTLMLHLVRPQTEMGNETRKKEGDSCDSGRELVPRGMQNLETVKLGPLRKFICNILEV